MKNQKVRIISLILALTMALTLAACGGNPDTPSGGNPPVVPIDGDFLRFVVVSNSKDEGGIWGFGIAFLGDTTGANPDLSDIKVFFDGAPLSVNVFSIDENWLDTGDEETAYSVRFGFGNGDEYLDKPGDYTFEITCNGVVLRHTVSWSEDGSVSVVETSPLAAVNILNTVPPTQSTGDDTPDTTTPTPGADNQNTPDNDSPAPSDDFEYLLFANAQIIEDAVNNQNEYFCPTTDDYVTDYSSIIFRPNEDETNELVEGLSFRIISFDENGYFASICEKFVFETPEIAELFANTPNRYHDSNYGTLEWDGSTDVFCDRFPDTGPYEGLSQNDTNDTKSKLIAVNMDYYRPRIIIEISKP